MASQAAFNIPPHVLYRRVDGQMVLLDVEREEYFGLNEVGADIVGAVTSVPIEEALDTVAVQYDIDAATLRDDAAELIDALLAAGLLTAGDAG